MSISCWLLLNWQWGFWFLGGFVFDNDTSKEALIEECFLWSIQCWVPLCFLECHSAGAATCIGQWILNETLCSWYYVLNNYAGSGSVIHVLLFHCWNMHNSEVSQLMEMFEKHFPLMRGLVCGLRTISLRLLRQTATDTGNNEFFFGCPVSSSTYLTGSILMLFAALSTL